MRTNLGSSLHIDRIGLTSALLLLCCLLSACDGSRGSRGKAGAAGPAGDGGTGTTDTQLTAFDTAPGVNIEITGLSGASGVDGQFLPGDIISATFTLKKDDDSSWSVSEFDRLRAMVGGPTFNYQRVIAEVSDLPTMTVDNGDGTFSYTFATPIPETYLDPYNNPGVDDVSHGVLNGMPLLGGTYTLGIYGRWTYNVDGDPRNYRDVGDTTFDFMVGDAGPLTPRDVAGEANCNECHVQIQAHGGFRQNVTICLMCHTAGAVDEAAEPKSVEFGPMVHKIHNGAHLPSVLGVSTAMDGSRIYDATPVPYTLDGHSVADFSNVLFPVWPSLSFPTLRDEHYSVGDPGEVLSFPERSLEDQMRRGVIACDKCHGDPDGDGPLDGPAEGDLAYLQPTRNACGSCHDDVVWEFDYVANGQLMGPQVSDAACTLCHEEEGSDLDVRDAHLHPLLNPVHNPGLHFNITAVSEAGPTMDGNDAVDGGEKISVAFTITDDADGVVLPGDIFSISLGISGPTSNLNLVHHQGFPQSAMTGGPNYDLMVPESHLIEFVGDSTGALDIFETLREPLYDSVGVTTKVETVEFPTPGPDVGDSTADGMASAANNYIDVADGSGFFHDDYIVIDDDVVGFEEYMKVQHVDGNRLWFSSPATSGYPYALRHDHADGAEVKEVEMTPLVLDTDYDLTEADGEINELIEIGVGVAVVASYTSDFVMPMTYPDPLNGSPDLDETRGKWSGKAIAEGNYLLSIWGYRSLDIIAYGESNTYRGASDDPAFEFPVGDPDADDPWELISSGDNCLACHDELRFHGGTRAGFDTCLVCHGSAGSEDRPPYVAGNALPTTGVGIDFREMLHKIHMGNELANASTYTVMGFGFLPYPANSTPHKYGEVHFPAFPAGPQDCVKCHGDTDAWKEPASRNHPDEQGDPTRVWRQVCSACHDSDASVAHIDANTAPLSGAESCAICHGAGKDVDVELVHVVR